MIKCRVEGSGPVDAEFYIVNSSLDVIIDDVEVNGVSLTGVTGTGFPLSTLGTGHTY